MLLKPINYFFVILLFVALLFIESFLTPYLTSLFFINWLLIFIIFINFNFPFVFVFLLSLISSLIFDSLTFNYWSVHFGLFLSYFKTAYFLSQYFPFFGFKCFNLLAYFTSLQSENLQKINFQSIKYLILNL